MSALQYIVVRGDLNWPLGAIIAQGCHACVAAIAKNLDTENTKNYLNKLESMHKVVLKAENEQQLLQLSSVLQQNNVPFHLWVEQPENVNTCLATAPCKKTDIAQYFKQFKLYQ